jgi:hypothetical protein
MGIDVDAVLIGQSFPGKNWDDCCAEVISEAIRSRLDKRTFLIFQISYDCL